MKPYPMTTREELAAVLTDIFGNAQQRADVDGGK